MRIHLTNTGAISLLNAHVFTELDVFIDEQPTKKIEQAIAQIGYRDGEQHIRIAPDILRFLSGHAGNIEWEKNFLHMLDYAAQAGWINAQGKIRAHITLNLSDQVVSTQDFKAAMRALPAGVSLVTTGAGNQAAGLVVSSLTSISAEPPLVGFFVGESSSITSALLSNGRFVANVLSDSHHYLLTNFLTKPQGPERFTEGKWRNGLHDLPVLSDALTSVECDIINTQALGTHRLIVGKIRHTESRPANPIINFNAGLHKLALLPH